MAAINPTHNGNEIATHEMRVQAANDAIATLRALGREDLIDHLTIEWSTRFTSRLGDACYFNTASLPAWRQVPKKIKKNVIDGICAHVRFSAPIWPRASVEERYNTVVHEIAHIVASHEADLAGRRKPQAHGSEWKRVMLRAGVRPERCHHVDPKGLKGKKSRKTEVAHCDCKDHAITPAMAKKIGNGSLYYCRSCKGYLVLGSKDSHLPEPEAKPEPEPTTINGYTIPSPSAMGF